MHHAEEHGFLTDNQYGGCQGQEAIDILVLTAWQLDIFVLSISNMTYTGCDACACYDRVVPEIAALAQCQAGLPMHAAKFFLKALKQMEYHMVTDYGVSKLMAKKTEDNPIYGLGQGATNVLPNWSLVVNNCKRAYDKIAKRCTIIDPTRAILLKSNGKMFVDNKNWFTMESNGHTGKDTNVNCDSQCVIIGALYLDNKWLDRTIENSIRTDAMEIPSIRKPYLTPENEVPTNTVVIN
eukprot:3897215-Ditylum_brightwellii.AAC.1